MFEEGECVTTIEVGSLSFRLTRENIHDSLIILSGNKAAITKEWGRHYRSSVRAHISPVASLILSVASLTAGEICFPRQLTSTIFIQSKNFIDRKCSLDSELSKFDGINVIRDTSTCIGLLDFRAIRDRLKTDFLN